MQLYRPAPRFDWAGGPPGSAEGVAALAASGEYPDLAYRQRTLKAHQRTTDLIDQGAGEQAALVMRRHLQTIGQESSAQHEAVLRRPVKAQSLLGLMHD